MIRLWANIHRGPRNVLLFFEPNRVFHREAKLQKRGLGN